MAKAKALSAAISGCRAASSPQDVADGADLVFLTVPDDAIAAISRSVRWRSGQSVVHCSGGAELEVLEPARQAGAAIGSFHPLQMFSETESALRGLARCAIAVEAEPPLLIELERLARLLGSRLLHVPRGKRALYHAASHYAAAYLCVLLEEGASILESLDIERGEARLALLGLARGALDAVERDDPVRAMAGVYARGDIGTAERHLGSLAALGPEALSLYQALADRSIRMALEAGRITPERAEAMRRLLNA
jgi:predicted short-subunit dehydrogenase-like oxidoreductase (DUF2520 family)